MSLRRLGLVPRLALAMTLIAVVAVGASTILVRDGVDARLQRFAATRLHDLARSDAHVAATLYGRGWTPQTQRTLAALGQIVGYQVTLVGAPGAPGAAAGAPRSGQPGASAPVVVDGRVVGRVRVTWAQGGVFDAEARALHEQLDRTRLVGAALTIALALLAAAIVASSFVRPLRRLTEVTERMERGDLDARAAGGGGAEIERLGRAFNRLAATLRREDDLRRDATADIAHELRTPVAGIVARIEAAQDGVLADAAGNLEAMHAEALRLARLIDDVGKLAEAEQPELLLARDRLDLGAVAARRAELALELFAAREIALTWDVAGVRVLADRHRLEQVIDNLISNALRYTDPGGRVVVTVRRAGDAAALEVRDTGIGISAGDAERVFERFWRGDRSRSRATGGSGIGLAVVRSLVHAHDGRVELESAVGRGTTFRVLLPAAEPAWAPAPAATATARRPGAVLGVPRPAG
ncbi:MAG: two-component system, OmpR family, sensor histidine kinase BaeS [Solirubrobacteraceae bacterium]|jgi:two-component system sensor histidine kinase BaeS|nr:two-component system, OmpR family, sensor histidine kinase BaeS [Solirubrobacteraceae bacterium]